MQHIIFIKIHQENLKEKLEETYQQQEVKINAKISLESKRKSSFLATQGAEKERGKERELLRNFVIF